MRKAIRYCIQYGILAVFVFFIYQTAFKRDVPPVHNRDLWSQRDGFVAISYGGITVEDSNRVLVTKTRLREQLETLAKAGYQTVTTQDILDFYKNNKPLPDKALYLMFEGGRKDSVLFSQPVLTKVGYNAALYLYGDRLTGWNRFFVRNTELRKIADNPFWDVNSMGYHSSLINLTPSGRYDYYLTSYLLESDGKPAEAPEAFDKRVEEDYQLAASSLDKLAGKPPHGYVFMPANTLGVSLPEAIAKPNEEDLARFFPLAFTRVGESYNAREANPLALSRMQVGPEWSAERLLLEIESRMPKSSFMDFSESVKQGLWQVYFGDMGTKGQELVLTSPKDKDAFARLRGSESFENFICEVKTNPAPDGASLVYLRYRNAGSFVRVQTTADRVLIQEKNGPALNTIYQTLFRYTLPVEQTGPISYFFCVKGNRLIVRVNGTSIGSYPIPLSPETNRGSFALGSLGAGTAHAAVFSDLKLRTFPPRWVQAGQVADVPMDTAETLTTMILPAASLQADPVRDAAALVAAATNGVAVFLDMPEADKASVEDTLRFVESAPGAIVFSKLLRGFVLPLDRFEDAATLRDVAAAIHAKGYEVALRLSPRSKARLVAMDLKIDPDWLLFDLPASLEEEDMVVLRNRYDKARMLFRVFAPSGSKTVYYDVKG